MKTEDFWEAIVLHLKKKLSSQKFKTWVKPLAFRENENDFEILAPNQFVQQWIVDRFAKEIVELGKESKYKKQIKFVSNKAKKNPKPVENSLNNTESKTKLEELSSKSAIDLHPLSTIGFKNMTTASAGVVLHVVAITSNVIAIIGSSSAVRAKLHANIRS